MGKPNRRATYEDLMQVPDTKVAELLDGELVVNSRPASPHARAAALLGSDLVPAVDGHDASGPGRWWLLPEPEIRCADDALVPDWAGWRRERMSRLVDTAFFTITPDWVCEIVSPSTGRLDRTRRMQIYARDEVGFLWLVDPLAKTVEVYRLEDGRWIVAGVHGGDDVVRMEPFPAVEIRLDRWWLPDVTP